MWVAVLALNISALAIIVSVSHIYWSRRFAQETRRRLRGTQFEVPGGLIRSDSVLTPDEVQQANNRFFAYPAHPEAFIVTDPATGERRCTAPRDVEAVYINEEPTR